MVAAEARCTLHDAPQLQCTCGIHAATDLDELIIPPSGAHLLVAVGQVSLWGRVEEHDTGYRAKYAYPYSLEIRPKMRPTYDKATAVAHELTAVYGVETTVRFPHGHRQTR